MRKGTGKYKIADIITLMKQNGKLKFILGRC
jgi:hypothetical protein